MVRREGRRVILEPVDAWSDEFLNALGSVSRESPRPKQLPLSKLENPFGARAVCEAEPVLLVLVATVGPPNAMALYMLDMDIVCFALRGIGDRISERKRSEICISAITRAELRFGAESRGSKRIHRAVEVFVSEVEVLPFDDAAPGFGIVVVR